MRYNLEGFDILGEGRVGASEGRMDEIAMDLNYCVSP